MTVPLESGCIAGSTAHTEPTTRPSLLIRLRDCRDHEAWESFGRLYGPLIFRFSRCRGLQEHDAAEVMQETLLQIAKSIRTFEYEQARGRFRGWIGSIVRSKIVEFRRQQNRMPKLEDAVLEDLSITTDCTWNEIWLEHVVQAALAAVERRLAPQTWTAFRRVWFEDERAVDVAADLGRDVAWVYLAKSRGLSLLREEVGFLADESGEQLASLQISSISRNHHAVSNHARAAK